MARDSEEDGNAMSMTRKRQRAMFAQRNDREMSIRDPYYRFIEQLRDAFEEEGFTRDIVVAIPETLDGWEPKSKNDFEYAMSYEEIGKELGIGAHRVGVIIRRAFYKIRKSGRLKEYRGSR